MRSAAIRAVMGSSMVGVIISRDDQRDKEERGESGVMVMLLTPAAVGPLGEENPNQRDNRDETVHEQNPLSVSH